MTVEELQGRMSQREFAMWCAYVDEYGELSPARRWDRGPALVSYMLQALQGGKQTLADFLPYHREPDPFDAPPETIEAVLLARFAPPTAEGYKAT